MTKNLYFVIPIELLDEVKAAVVIISNLPHEQLHWRLSVDKTKAIIQGNFSPNVRAWIQTQNNVIRLGEYKNGKPETKVHDFMKTNKSEWQKPKI